MANIFKSLSPTDYSIVPYPAYYRYLYTYESGSVNNSPDVTLTYAVKFLTSSGVNRTPNISYELFDSVMQTFYSDIPYTTYGITTTSYIPSSSVYVVSITQDLFGREVLPGSFSIKIANTQSYDDGKGNIIVSSSGTGGIIGRIFYDKGIALLKPTSSIAGGGINNKGIFISNGNTVNIYFSSSVILYENIVKAKLDPTDFMFSLHNPSVKSSITGSTTTPVELMVSGNLDPYVTTIGFYNDNDELLLVGKPSVPIKRTRDLTQTFIVKFDV